MSAGSAQDNGTPIPPAHRAGPGSGVLAALGDIKVAHSVFALPFAVFAAFLCAPRNDGGAVRWTVFGGQLGLVVACMVLARTWAMVVNRIADHGFDSQNPRTARRAIPSGRATVGQARVVAIACALAFCGAAFLFRVFYGNPWPVMLAVPVLGWIALYSFTKRFTWLCHVFLGGALGASPIAAAIAVNPDVVFGAADPGARALVVHLALFVVLWVAGFDVLYALADIEVDRRLGLRSIPARVGVRGALWVSRGMHALGFATLVIAAAHSGLGPLFPCAVALVGCLLVFEHIVVSRRGVAGLPVAFFTVNGVISVMVGAAGIADVVMGS